MPTDERPPAPDGIVVVDKPAGWTSHDVVAKSRGLLGTRKVGHAGTLDPDATGVLLLGVGRATKLLRFLSPLGKSYVGEIVLGVETTTLDAAGDVTRDPRHGRRHAGRRAAGRRAVRRPDPSGPADGVRAEGGRTATSQAGSRRHHRRAGGAAGHGPLPLDRGRGGRRRRVPHHGRLLGRDLCPVARGRHRYGAGRWRAPAKSPADLGRTVRRDRRGRPRRAGTRGGASDGRRGPPSAIGHRRRRSWRRRSRSARCSSGQTSGSMRTVARTSARGRSSASPGTCWPSTNRTAGSTVKPAVVVAPRP